jgi:GT2 family glycosyltransferase
MPTPVAPKTVSIVIPNYNGRALLEQYLPYTFTAITNAAVDFEVIVIDDCSTDDSVEYLQRNYPQVKLLLNQQNRGFSYTCNKGIAAAGMELILLLNSDVKLSPTYFEPLWPYFEKADTFGVMGRITNLNDPHIQDAARMPKDNFLKLKTAYFYYSENNNKSLTLYLSGANALIDAGKLKALGGFNLLFSPFYCEDFELSLRAWRLNWACYYEHHAVCGHELSASTKNYKTARWVKMIYFRNRYYLHALHLSGITRFLWFLQITLLDLPIKVLSGKTWLLTSYVQFIKHRKEIKQHKALFKEMMAAHNSTTTISQVINTLTRSVEGKKISKFNS